MELTSGSAIVTGAAGGIGSVISARLASQGMSVVMADLDAEGLELARAAILEYRPDADLVALVGDVSDPAYNAELIAAAEDSRGLRLSVLNAAVSLPGLSWEEPIDRWELTVNVNLWGVVHGMRAALATMVPRGDGWVVAISSGAGLVATPGLAPYVATKHAIVGLMESTHHELARVGSDVGVSVICPGNIDTATDDKPAMAGIDAADGSAFPEVIDAIQATTRRGVESGADPSTVADALVAGVGAGRFWVLPQPELAWAATDRMRRLAEGEDPVDLLG